jgi:hypothetical protein
MGKEAVQRKCFILSICYDPPRVEYIPFFSPGTEVALGLPPFGAIIAGRGLVISMEMRRSGMNHRRRMASVTEAIDMKRWLASAFTALMLGGIIVFLFVLVADARPALQEKGAASTGTEATG